MEFIKKLKNEVEQYYSMDDFIDAHYNEKYYSDIRFVETLSTDEHRWYILEENVYNVNVEGKDYYFGILEIGSLKSESMGIEDTGITMKMFEVEKIVKQTFRRKQK